MTRTTPPRPVDVTAIFPELAPFARTAYRLHPRNGAPTAHDSSVGGPLLWPAEEPWPSCAGPHEWDKPKPVRGDHAESLEGVRTTRRLLREEASRPGPRAERLRPEEREALRQANARVPWPANPVPMLPVAQLWARDVPLPGLFAGTDVLQVLWCPFDHDEDGKPYPRVTLRRRTAADVTDVLAEPPRPASVQYSGYVPEPCLLAPERVTEYPNLMELALLEPGLAEEIEGESRWEAAGVRLDALVAEHPDLDPDDAERYEDLYRCALSLAPGWKAGGWSTWGRTDPVDRPCPACGTPAEPLLTLASTEAYGDSGTWIPYEDRDLVRWGHGDVESGNQAALTLGDCDTLQLHACPAHPFVDLVQ
ncbi:hypothetical protein [Streptomyces sp. CA-253872]|uniref:hypothetical protein n=1 Tax=Streptomyces sp. CA-253872 TaxID=3240067 RepID=UPI003D8D7F1C